MKELFPPATRRSCVLCAISLIVFIILMANADDGTIGVPAIDLGFLICLLLEIILVPIAIIYSFVAIIKDKTLFSVMWLLVYLLVIVLIISS